MFEISKSKLPSQIALVFLFAALAGLQFGCSSTSQDMAVKGGTTGALAGAVGGMVSAAIFGGNVGEAAARGAVWGGATGATAGAITGAQVDARQREADQQAQLNTIKAELGEDAFQGLTALAQCKHEIALGYARTAAQSSDKEHQLAGLWLEVLTEQDRGQLDSAKPIFASIVEKDKEIGSEDEISKKSQAAISKLEYIRQEYDLPQKCS